MPSLHRKHILNQRQIELKKVESRLVATQWLVQTPNNQVNSAKSKQGEQETDNKKLKCQLGEAKVRLDHDHEDEDRLKVVLDEVKAEVEECKQCADRWQRISVAELHRYASDPIRQAREVTLATLQEKVDNAEARIAELVNHSSSMETHLDDLEFELGINERRLTCDESLKTGFHEQHWSTMKKTLEENKSKIPMVKALEARFSKELARNPLKTATIITETSKDHVGPELNDRNNALYRIAYEAREGRGEHDLRCSNLDQERITAIYGHGPAGYKPRPQKNIPEGYAERKAARDIANLKWQVKEMKLRLWRYEKDATNIEEVDGDLEMEDYVRDAE